MGGESVMRWPEDPNAPKIASYDLALIRLKNQLLQGKHLRRDGVLAIEETDTSFNDSLRILGDPNSRQIILVGPNYMSALDYQINEAIKEELKDVLPSPNTIELQKVEFAEPYNDEGLRTSKHIKQKKQQYIDLAKKKKRRAIAKQSRKQNRR
jgi:hypothetical protein